MKREREKNLKLGIKAIEHRLKQLSDMLDAYACPLCREHPLCTKCIARKTDYGCFDFVDDVNKIRYKLIEQQSQWMKELEDASK